MSEFEENKNSDNDIVGYLIFSVIVLAIFKTLAGLDISWILVFSPIIIPFITSIIAVMLIIAYMVVSIALIAVFGIIYKIKDVFNL